MQPSNGGGRKSKRLNGKKRRLKKLNASPMQRR
jgi:hypothetical protein